MYLGSGYRGNLQCNMVTYDLEIADSDNFLKIASDIIYSLMDGCTALSVFDYKKINHGKKSMFIADEYIERTRKYIFEARPDWQFCDLQIDDGRKYFFIKSDNADRKFIEYSVSDYNFIHIAGYMKEKFSYSDDIIRTARDFADFKNISHEAISCYLIEWETMMQIMLNPSQYPVDKMLTVIKNTAEKYGKTLKVQI